MSSRAARPELTERCSNTHKEFASKNHQLTESYSSRRLFIVAPKQEKELVFCSTNPVGMAKRTKTLTIGFPDRAAVLVLSAYAYLNNVQSVLAGILRSLLNMAGQDVFLASNGEEAVFLAIKQTIKLVILDLDMPRLNGFLACQKIRAIPGYAAVPVVILTGHGSDYARRAATIVGASIFLTKPF